MLEPSLKTALNYPYHPLDLLEFDNTTLSSGIVTNGRCILNSDEL